MNNIDYANVTKKDDGYFMTNDQWETNFAVGFSLMTFIGILGYILGKFVGKHSR